MQCSGEKNKCFSFDEIIYHSIVIDSNCAYRSRYCNFEGSPEYMSFLLVVLHLCNEFVEFICKKSLVGNIFSMSKMFLILMEIRAFIKIPTFKHDFS